MNSLSMLAGVGITAALVATVDFPAPMADAPTATLTYARGGPGWTDLSGYDREDCAKGSGGLIKSYGKGLFKKDVGPPEVRVVAGKPLYLRATSLYSDFGWNIICTNVSSFTPRAGGRYEVVQEPDGKTCVMLIRDLDNKRKPPPDAKPLPVTPACLKAG